MPWLRKDYLLDRWVIFSKERASRPSHYVETKTIRGRKRCAFCPGNERMTPPAVKAYRWNKGALVSIDDRTGFAKKWAVRIVPNLYPFTTREDVKKIRRGQEWHAIPAIGRHEVVIESPNHKDHPGLASTQQTAASLKATIEHVRALAREERPKHISIFRNHRAEAGATISHAHSQILTTPVIPWLIEQELASAHAYLKRNRDCAFCRLSKAESRSKRRILNTKQFRVFAPWASIASHEFWIVPKTHESSILRLEEVNDLAETLDRCMLALYKALGDIPYNYSFHSSLNPARSESYHWHLEVYPRLNALAGLEIGGELYANPVFPEQAARTLRRCG